MEIMKSFRSDVAHHDQIVSSPSGHLVWCLKKKGYDVVWKKVPADDFHNSPFLLLLALSNLHDGKSCFQEVNKHPLINPMNQK